MAKIFLNEGTEIEVKETREEIRSKIRNKFTDEAVKDKHGGAIDHFIEVTMIKKRAIGGDVRGDDFIKYKTTEISTDLYYKRILFIYD